MPILFAIVGTVLSLGVIAWYFAVIDAEKVPASVGPFAGTIVVGMVLAGVGAGLQPGLWTVGALALDLAMGGLALWLLTLRRLPDGQLVVGVGQPMPPLSAVTDTGAPFDLASLKGRRVLLKFFRGSW